MAQGSGDDAGEVIDFDEPVPVYIQLAQILARQIRSGRLPLNRAIPSQRDLTDRYGVARGTVAKAIQVLHEDGLVVTVRGKGVWTVRELPPASPEQ